LATLAAADVVLAEDTRVTKTLLAHYGIATPLVAYHEHNAAVMRPHLLARLEAGAALALVSDAGTPLVSDPGFKLVADSVAQGFAVFGVPGPSAVLAALVVAGLPTDRFFFEGFLPQKSAARRQRISALAPIPGTLIFFESARRTAECLADLAAVLGNREAAVCRELTKKFETVRRGTLAKLAAEFAEAIFSPHLTIAAAKAYYDDVKGRMQSKYDRHPDHLKVLPGLSVVVAESDDKAAEDFEALQSLIHPIVGREILSTMLGGMDLTPFPLDEPLPDPLPPTNGSKGHYDSIVAMARRENLTIRQLGQRVAGARGKNAIHGSARKVADMMEEWFAAGACDGFCVMPPYMPGQHDDFCAMVVPELQKRGIFRKEYEGATLRANLGLPLPPSRYAR
jgi:16S rRNA (cytidine(1402)-2'-O)-methyltransferase